MSGAASVGVAATFGFLEAPLKFWAPVTLRIGLGIGRLVFRTLNAVEAILSETIVVLAALGSG